MGLLAAMGVAMSKALFAYDAWNTVTFAAEEVREPAAQPAARAGGRARSCTTLAYVAACAVYLYVLPLDRMAAVVENRVAADVARRRCSGRAGVTLVSVAILVSTFGCVNGLILGGARVLFAMARDGLFFRVGRAASTRARQTPRGALVLQGLWSVVLALSGSYDRAAHVRDVRVARVQRAHRRRPLRAAPDAAPTRRGRTATWGYPVTPALYLVGALFFLALHLRRRSAGRMRRTRPRRARTAGLCGLHATGKNRPLELRSSAC